MRISQRRGADRLFPSEPGTRTIARSIYQEVAEHPIISPHGHVPISWLDENAAFSDPAALLVTGDHYITRMLHSAGVSLKELGPNGAACDPREVFRTLARHWHLFVGTASGYWLEQELDTIFEIDAPLTSDTADAIYDHIDAALATDEFRPRVLFDRFGIEFLATTDDPLADLGAHARVGVSGLGGRVVPTFRPDAYVDPDHSHFAENVGRLAAAANQELTFDGYLRSLESRRRHFVAHGAISADHGVQEPLTLDMSAASATSLFDKCLEGTATSAERRSFRAHMLFQMARMSVDDGLVMTVHAGVYRNHSSSTLAHYGADTGHDIPVPTTFTSGMRPLLEQFGLEPGFHLVLFAVDETVYSRELAPLAGFYPSVYVGAPWWFLDAPDAMGRFRSAVTESAGFYRTSGFIDDTRAFMSIPARHDVARRADAAFLARLVAEERVTMSQAVKVMGDVVSDIPRKVFKL